MKRSRGEIVGSALVAAFVVVVAVFPTAVSVSVTAAERGAAGGGVVERGWSDWEYSKSVLVKENSGATLTDYQVLLNLSGEDFPAEAKTDGSDLRFVDAEEEEELSYWLEKFDAANETGRVWVKVPEIPADGEAELKMLYGNPSAESASNGSAVFEFFDDFESYAVGSKPPTWSQSGNSVGKIDDAVSVSGTKSFKLYGITGACWANCAHKYLDMQPPYCIDFDVYNGNEALSGCHSGRGTFELWEHLGYGTGKRGFICFKRDGTIRPLSETYLVQQWYHVKMKYAVNDTNATISYWINDDYKGTFSYSKASYESDLKYYTIVAQEGSAWFDNTRLRNYADPEPTVTIKPYEEEEEPTVSIETDEFEYYAGDTMNVEIEVENPTEDRLNLQWWWLVPEYSVCVGLTAMPLSVPSGYDETLEYSFAVPDLGAKWFSNAFFVQLAETEAGGGEGAGGGGEVLDADAACWIYRPAGREAGAAQTAVGEAEVEIADEIRRAVEGVK